MFYICVIAGRSIEDRAGCHLRTVVVKLLNLKVLLHNSIYVAKEG